MGLRLENVSVQDKGQTIIDRVSLGFARGSMNVLLGPTLAGKTTLMRLMAGLDRPTSGTIHTGDRNVTGLPVTKRSVAMVYQQFVNYPTLSVYENIASPLRVARLNETEVDRRVRAAARLVGLEPLLKRMPNQVSGGQQQRTAIARAIVKGAEIVMLDEPLANLDYKLREELREELPRIFQESGAILVYATTEPLEALQLGGNTATLSKGRVTEFGPTAEVYHDPETLETARVFSDPPLNEVAIAKENGIVRTANHLHLSPVGHLATAASGHYTMACRADIVRIARPYRNSLELTGSVAVAEISGSESYVHVETPIGTFVCVEPGVSGARLGEEVTIFINADRVFLFDKEGRRAGPRSSSSQARGS